MKKIILSMMIAAVAVGAMAQKAMDARSRMIARTITEAALPVANANNGVQPPAKVVMPVQAVPFSIDRQLGDQNVASVFVTMAGGRSADAVADYGLTVDATAGNMAVVSGTVADIVALANSDLVTKVAFGNKVDVKLDLARKDTGMDRVHTGDGLVHGFKGEGVVCGVYDTGLAPNHINFRDMAFDHSRVKRVWHYNGTGGGSTLYKDDEVANFTTDAVNASHGTHTLGCMAGGFNLKGNMTGKPQGRSAVQTSTGGFTRLAAKPCPFYGAAPEADIVACCGSLYDANIVAGIRKMANYAKTEAQKPVVINLSIGTTVGSHDAESDFCTMLDNVIAETGAIVCVSAGNEGTDPISIIKRLTNTDKTMITAMPSTKDSNSGRLSIYASNGGALKITFFITDRQGNMQMQKVVPSASYDYYYTSSNYSGAGYIKDAVFDKAFASNSYVIITPDCNGSARRSNVSIQYSINNNATTNANKDLVMGFMVEGAAGQRIDVTHMLASGACQLSDLGQAGWSAGTPDLSISSMACGKNTIAVGSYTTKDTWGVLKAGAAYSYRTESGLVPGLVSPFSSYGTLADGRTLPLVCGPGAAIVSSVNSYDTQNYSDPEQVCGSYTWNNRTYNFDYMQGTSMSSPYVAGVIATWLQAASNLTPAQVVDIIKTTSDAPTGTLTPAQTQQWGVGKINAYEGLKKALTYAGVSDILAEDTNILVSDRGGNRFEVFATGSPMLRVNIYGTSGALVKQIAQPGDCAELDLSDLGHGIYVMQVNGAHSQRIAVK